MVVWILLYGWTTWTPTKHIEKNLDGNCTRMLWAILNKSWKPHPTKQQLYGPLLPIFKTIQVRRTKHAGHCWRCKNEFINDLLLWTPLHGRASVRRPTRTYLQQLCTDTGYNLENVPRVMDDMNWWREKEKEREREREKDWERERERGLC